MYRGECVIFRLENILLQCCSFGGIHGIYIATCNILCTAAIQVQLSRTQNLIFLHSGDDSSVEAVIKTSTN